MSWGSGSSVHMLLAALRERYAELETADREVQRLRGVHQQCRADVDARLRHAQAELLAALVPNLDPRALQRAAWLTGYAALTHPSVHGNMKAESERLRARIAEIEADPRFANRELLRAPRVGTLVQRLAELEHYRDPLALELADADHPRLERLLDVGYGTPSYDVPFWRTAYYADWKAGDEILERFPQKKTFAEVRASVVAARDAVATYDARIREVCAEIQEGESLEAEHKTQTTALETLPERTVMGVRAALGRHLGDIDMGVLGDRFAQAPDVDVLAKRVFGLASKLAYLDSTTQHYLDRDASEIATARSKLSRELMKYSRPKMHYAVISADVMAKRSRPFGPRFSKNFQRYQKTYTRVYGFEDYRSARLSPDFLWWDLMTDGRVDGDFIPEVRGFRERHPDYHYTRPRYEEEDDAAAAAAAASWDSGDGDDMGGDALVDAS